jgi:DNA-binding response OmpR family regulator
VSLAEREAIMVAARDNSNRNVVLALPESDVAAETAERLHGFGWRVHRVADCDALRELTCHMAPDVVVLPADGPDESGWLTCAKLMRAIPRLRVLVVGEPTGEATQMARFIGAEAPVPADVGAAELADRVQGAILV